MVPSRSPANAMTYDGLDGELINAQFMQINVSTTGLTMRQPIAHSWLDYMPGGTAFMSAVGQDILTGWMSGCPLARWTSSTGQILVGHIGTIDTDPVANARVKSKFLAGMDANTTLFDPYAEWSTPEIMTLQGKFRTTEVNPHVMGLIAASGEVFAILIFNIKPKQGGAWTEWCIGGIKRVNAMSAGQVKLKLG
jgi:hypothetical protein